MGNLEIVDDVKNQFSVGLPKSWKTNLYYDAVQSSIFSADTTKQLTETVLIDVSYIKEKIDFSDAFKLKLEQENLSNKLIQTTSKEINLLQKSSYYSISRGKKGKFAYQMCNTFIKLNDENFLQIKTEVYGDSLVNERFCKAFQLINTIKIKS